MDFPPSRCVDVHWSLECCNQHVANDVSLPSLVRQCGPLLRKDLATLLVRIGRAKSRASAFGIINYAIDKGQLQRFGKKQKYMIGVTDAPEWDGGETEGQEPS